eukprot:CAMPEP_0171589412 /NCGR_PEP_ID=MMETSP0961-20121227/14829_1 /TAXON_ID=87120 /ORGANISM="Aurantiochytrium limacinum, Strain ATCCMYA-1381" /LENGTH=648 /DNA_ID=CAMNT_0012148697 /DNA_START=157 /DNA_END=2103 /DNA_ORIENTATION=+
MSQANKRRGLRQVWNERHVRGLEPVLREISEILRQGDDEDRAEWLEIQASRSVLKPSRAMNQNSKQASTLATQNGKSIARRFSRDELISDPTWMPKIVAHLETRLRNGNDDFDKILPQLELTFGSIREFQSEIEDAIDNLLQALAEDTEFQEAEAERTKRKALRNYAAERFQIAWRTYRFRSAVASSPFRKLRLAIRFLQAHIRRRLACLHYARTMKWLGESSAARSIQKAYLIYRRREYDRKIHETRLRQAQRRREKHCVLRIQKAWRVHVYFKTRAVIGIQKAWRFCIVQRQLRKRQFLAQVVCARWWLQISKQRQCTQCAIRIQHQYRRFLLRRRLQQLASTLCQIKQVQAIRKIQHWFSAMLQRYKAALLIQSMVRCWKARSLRTKLRCIYVTKQSDIAAALKVQQFWRKVSSSWRLRQTKQHAATCIQYFIKRVLVYHNRRKDAAALLLQGWIRRRTTHIEHLKQLSKHQQRVEDAAITVQRIWRGARGRTIAMSLVAARKRRLKARIEYDAANIIQRQAKLHLSNAKNNNQNKRLPKPAFEKVPLKQTHNIYTPSKPEHDKTYSARFEVQDGNRIVGQELSSHQPRMGLELSSGRLYGARGSQVGASPQSESSTGRLRTYKVPKRTTRALPPVRAPRPLLGK